MIKLSILDENEILYGEQKLDKEMINSSVLEEIFRKAIKGELEFKLNNNFQISKLFERIEQETSSDSEFMKKVNEINLEYDKLVELKAKIPEISEVDDLPF